MQPVVVRFRVWFWFKLHGMFMDHWRATWPRGQYCYNKGMDAKEVLRTANEKDQARGIRAGGNA